MTAYSTKNAHGVYMDREVLELPLDRKGWRGMALAQINLAYTEAGPVLTHPNRGHARCLTT